MLNKLAFRNAKRSMRDYAVYLITMTAVAAMMFAFNSLIFSEDIRNMCSEAMVLGIMLGFVTFFIVLIVAWLINYMAGFMLRKRSREFALYLLIGLKKKELSRLYLKENLLIGTAALIFGIAAGTLLQQIIMTVFYSVFSEDYPLHIQMSGWCLLMTAGCYFACYLFALMRNKRVFKKMSIAELIQMEKKNEDLKVKHEKVRQWLFFLAVALYPLCLLHDGPRMFHPHGADSDGRICRCYLCHVCGIVSLYRLQSAEEKQRNVPPKPHFPLSSAGIESAHHALYHGNADIAARLLSAGRHLFSDVFPVSESGYRQFRSF